MSHRSEMTPNERLYALLAGKPIDQVPLYLMAKGFCAKIVGYDLPGIYTDAARHFWSQIWAGEMYGITHLCTRFSYHAAHAAAFGGEIKFPTGEFAQSPTVARHAVNSAEDVDKVRFAPVADNSYVRMMMEFSRLADRQGLPVVPHAGTPLTQTENLCGPQLLLTWMIKKPELVHRMLRMVTDYMLDVVRYFMETFGTERLIVFTAGSVESNQLISPKQFREFALPYLKESYEKMLGLGVKHIFTHICGDQNLNLPYWSQVPLGNPGIVSIGHEVDIATAIKYFGDTCIIAGNLETTVIQQGTPQRVYELAKKCIEEGKKALRGYVLMPGCELPPNAPPYNVYMLRKAINDFGRY